MTCTPNPPVLTQLTLTLPSLLKSYQPGPDLQYHDRIDFDDDGDFELPPADIRLSDAKSPRMKEHGKPHLCVMLQRFYLRDLSVHEPTVGSRARLLGPHDCHSWCLAGTGYFLFFFFFWRRPASKSEDIEDTPLKDIIVGEQPEGTGEKIHAGDDVEARTPPVRKMGRIGWWRWVDGGFGGTSAYRVFQPSQKLQFASKKQKTTEDQQDDPLSLGDGTFYGLRRWRIQASYA
ncbi:unnamed protein product [Penicillium roqueforti FM164]|uniref:Genomic scaffold, ProqFM164S01 n=1 Tax=Penicillium roqueforti (strain FM164) TaxID=1365484 RepID=W6Q0J7_PENRF|nr:unnamed protein product [Penicillium roqueforti FM164]